MPTQGVMTLTFLWMLLSTLGSFAREAHTCMPNMPGQKFMNRPSYIDGSVEDASNFCRSPVYAIEPWCFTTDPDTLAEPCDVTECRQGDVIFLVLL